MTYLMKMLELLAEQIFKMEETVRARPSAVNLTISKRRGKILKYLFGASIRCGTGKGVESINKQIAETRVRPMTRLFLNVPTDQEFEKCRQAWGNCSELVSIATLCGQWKPQRRLSVGDKFTGSSYNPPIVVEIVDSSNCPRVATSLGLDLHIETPQDAIHYVKDDLSVILRKLKNMASIISLSLGNVTVECFS
ncbi:9469_t:CDS:2 [Paraglomus occultum]|uniref:9469_t:CDS:1 n=1 Tax=Paraglomus occultum TaxID=144539 RepID=A0A9N9EYQ3_9GLOM|nr:9469_t:CDS:2 [Paraglomus occultum]